MRRALSVRLATVVTLASAMAIIAGHGARAADGDPVPGFGADGVVVDDQIAAPDQILVPIDVIEDAAGRLVVAAEVVVPGESSHSVLVRYLADGTRDRSFGSNGLAPMTLTGPVPIPIAGLTSVAELFDGSLLASAEGPGAFRVSSDGRTVTRLFGLPVLSKMTRWPDGSVMATERGTEQPFRIKPNGERDTGFVVAAVPRPAALSSQYTRSIVRLVDGRFITSTAYAAGAPAECRLTAFLPTGEIDSTFGNQGQVVFDDKIDCLVDERPDHTLLVARRDYLTANQTFVLLSAAGSVIGSTLTGLDPTVAHRAEVTGDGRTLVSTPDATLAFDVAGVPDSSWDSDGAVSFPGVTSGMRALEGGGVVVWGAPAANSPTLILQQLATSAGLAPQPPLVATSRFVPLAPARVLDTRIGVGAPAGKVAPAGQIDLRVTGAGGVPGSGVTAVVLNVTATEMSTPGFVSVYPGGARRPVVSSINVDRVGVTVPNLVTVPVGEGGNVSLFSSAATHLLADVAGYYAPATASAGGRFVAATPRRVLDTRIGLGAPAVKPSAGSTTQLDLYGTGPIPSSGVSAVVLNLTATDADGPSFVTAWPAGTPQPVVSNLNVDLGDTRPNLAIVPLGADGTISLFTLRSTHLLADVFGWYTDDTAVTGTAGLFVPISPARVLDSRERASTPLTAGSVTRLRVAGTSLVPPLAASAVALNVTATESGGPGFAAAVPSPFTAVTVSNLNLTRSAQTIANAAIVPVADESIDLYVSTTAHLVVDIGGWFVAA